MTDRKAKYRRRKMLFDQLRLHAELLCESHTKDRKKQNE